MDTKINFDFVSPEESIVSSEVDMVLIPAIEGDAGILPNHAPYMTILRQGIVEVTFEKDNIKQYFVEGGFADVTPQKITILAESSINLTDIDDTALIEKLKQIDENILNANESDKELLIERKAIIENFS
ncbi:MAG: ATP synthase F1 subunit epsilon [Alphaproteobacteria bacterium]|jgi:F-type H+-transporting ATPase subunit epsilon|nr:ATP synthase F1 subunit epsilon [Rhodobiaceae bacterium]MDC0184310.1 ATP synthase F1 subunit epsilon [Rhodobiaceae bacterium]PDH51113.1 MAG: ATP synthase F1 subunit epsilon [alpha proteobacterium MED-G09]|tara:strand:- start:334 stop:720 length:387 start_codon:yes stop_codon:yes gene_type:complete